jgi:hypothetical protein
MTNKKMQSVIIGPVQIRKLQIVILNTRFYHRKFRFLGKLIQETALDKIPREIDPSAPALDFCGQCPLIRQMCPIFWQKLTITLKTNAMVNFKLWKYL